QDVKFGWRSARANAAYSLVAIATLGLGIGANSAVFSVVHGVLLRPLDYADPDRLVTLLHADRNPVAPANMIDWRAQAKSFSAMAAAGAWSASLTGGERPERITAMQVSEGMFPLLGVEPLLGRTPAAQEHLPGRHRVAILSHSLWRERYHSDPSVTGRVLNLSGEPYTVIGVMPEHFRFAPFWVTDAQLWVPLTLQDKAASRGGQFLRVFARLAPGVSLGQAQAEMNGIWRQLQQAYPAENEGLTVEVTPLTEHAVGNLRRPLLVLLGAVGFVLLIACTNMANLTLTRGSARGKELAIRSALGASRWRLIRQLLTESMLLAIAGGSLGLVLAVWGVRIIRASVEMLPRAQAVSLDTNTLLYTAAISILTGLMFGIIPALQATRSAAAEALKEGSRGSSGGLRGAGIRDVLVTAEVAIAIVLLAGAGLLLRSFLSLRAIDPGFATSNVLSMEVSLAGLPDYTGERRTAFYRDVIREVSSAGGLTSAAIVNHLPLGGDVWYDGVHAEGRPLPEPGERLGAAYRVCSPGYFRTMRIRLLEGRDFEDRDTAGAPLVTIINEKLARKLWPGGGALGRRVTFDNPLKTTPRWRVVVGVAADVKQRWLTAEADGEFYIPFAQDGTHLNGIGPASSYMTLVASTNVPPGNVLRAAREAIWSVNKSVAVSRARAMEQVMAGALWQPRFYFTVLACFAGFALILAVIGIYGVIAYSVHQRRREIGIRLALGAGRGMVARMIVGQAMKLTAVGIALGLAAALWMSCWMASLLHDVTPADPATFLAVPLVLAFAAAAASYVPARRAARLNASAALRSE
ncbi:MAG: ABC transporter permease, partial [Bryobacteraceae bacterium]|nr:ABC transporter permease [Bryobacteraceae bacterium]